MTPWPEQAPQFSPQYTSTDFSSGRAALALCEVWQQASHGHFASVSQRHLCKTLPALARNAATSTPLQLHYSYWRPASAVAALVLIPGRIEAGHKYLEFIHEALVAGFEVFVLDHQGQGASDRLDQHSQIGDVRSFNDYVSDLVNFIQQIVLPRTKLPLLAVAHSMGGGILCRYLQQQPEHGFTAAVFCSPMWGIPTLPIPGVIARPLSQCMQWLNQRCHAQSWYVAGQQPYQNRLFAGNDLSQCPERYQWFRNLYQQFPEYQLGGVSWRWLSEALAACQQMQQGPIPTLPCLLLQAGADQVVDNFAQNRLWQRFSQQGSPLSIKHQLANAKHELLFETDDIRSQCLELINQFLSQLQPATHQVEKRNQC